MLRNLILLTFLACHGFAQTPVIGGTCKLGTADVQIGGKQTQFFLKCETTADSADGEGVWVVKSRAAAAAAPVPAPATLPTENTQPQQHPKARKPTSPNICEQDNGARENEACAVSATCLQAHNDFPSSYLQCDQTTLRWVRKSCQENFLFNFEQQTCIVPKRMSSLSLGCFFLLTIACTTTNRLLDLCSDGSPPNGTCFRDTLSCPPRYFCTAQRVCCPSTALQSSIGCSLVCTIDESCPKGMSCHNNCCEERKLLRHPKVVRYSTVDAANTIFEVDNDIFDSAAVESFATQKPERIEEIMAPAITPTPTRTTTDHSEQRPCLRSSEGNELLKASGGGACGGTNANCTLDDDCPTSFKCSNGCCRLAVCPRTFTPVRFTCTTQYHCRANEHCFFGACCPKAIELAVIKSQPITVSIEQHKQEFEELSSKEEQKPEKVMIGECEVDNRVKFCDIDIICPEMSECVDGVCCKIPPIARCGNGLIALTIPSTCDLSDDCPIASRCEYGKCCPLTSESEVEASIDEGNDVSPTQDLVLTKIWEKKKTTNKKKKTKTGVDKQDKGLSINKNKCLSSQSCDIQNLCPADFTCSLSGKCCKLAIRCPDGTVPETSCESADSHDICPSSSHKCTLLNNEHFACCYAPELAATMEGIVTTVVASDCPAGSVEVEPRFGASCRYSLQCPSPYFCQQANGLVCTFSSCSNSNPCSVGTCNNGYCCSSGSNSPPAIIMSGGSSNCVGCQNAPQIITIPQNSCPGGGYSVGGCSSGYCATGYSCIQNQCCPSYNSAPRISVFTCPSGGPAVGACISGRCASGYSCQNNACCPQTTTTNPFVCPDGTQAAGGCVNGKCGSGYSCSNGLCCAGTSNTVKCLDGSDAVGACIPSCQGDGCGGVQVSYYCGNGYTCTTGNICCPINSCPNGGDPLGPTINGLCPTGYTVQGSLCCSATCPDGSAGTTPVNGACISGSTLTNGVCCTSTSTTTCSDEISIGPCTGTGYNGGCPVGYQCDSNAVNCCPVVDYTKESCQVGPAIDGLCPPGYVVVYIPNSPLITNGVNPGTCIDVQCTSGICAQTDQIGECEQNTDTGTCPTGYTCNTSAGVCCSSTTFNRLRLGRGRPMAQAPVYGRPLHNYMPPFQMNDDPVIDASEDKSNSNAVSV
uniref:Chitin-binding type-2 domain-containing protein n=1 Tax=Caenorhabditis japonica TaxID=281687 RepID=A0A8R1DEA3_CAEJA